MYGVELWEFNEYEDIEKVQERYLKTKIGSGNEKDSSKV